MDPLLLALLAGSVAALNPCGFALLPAYLTLVVLGTGDGVGRTQALARALAATAMMALGFVVVFGLFGLVVAPAATAIQQHLPVVTIAIGVVLVVLGVLMLAGRDLQVMLPKLSRGAPTARLASMFGYGVAYAVASLSCTIGPFLAVTALTFQAGSVARGVAAYVLYGVGMAAVVGLAAVTVALVGAGAAQRIRSASRRIARIGGALLVLAGAYVAYYGVYEWRLFSGSGSASDPVVDAAGVVQGALARAVDTVGPSPFLGALALVVVAVLVRRRRAERTRVTASPEEARQPPDVSG